MKTKKLLLLCCLSVFFVGALYAQKDKPEKEPKCKLIKVCPDTIIGKTEYARLQQELAVLQGQPAATEASQLSPAIVKLDIDKFLNIQDTSIFCSNFQKLELDAIPARSRDFYSLIANIHELNHLLNSKTEGSDLERMRKARENLEMARKQIVIINSFGTDERRRVFEFLSNEQRLYWRQLVTTYNEFASHFNITGNENN